MTDVLGVLILSRNGDRDEFYQDPKTYEPSFTESTPLGAVRNLPFALVSELIISAGRVFPTWRVSPLGLLEPVFALLHLGHEA